MKGRFNYVAEFDECLRMPAEMMPPDSLYYFKPPKDVIFHGADRMIFEGEPKYTSDEFKHLKGFSQYQKDNKLVCEEMTFSMALRFLYASRFVYKDAFASIKSYKEWQETALPLSLNDKLLEALDTGFLRVFGRDRYYRPIIIVNLLKVLANPKIIEAAENACIYVLEHILHYMVVPGKVENWIVVIDTEGAGLTDIPVGPLKKMISCFQNNYPARLAKMVVLNVSVMMRGIWGIVEQFIDSNTRSKILLTSSPSPLPLLELINKEQLLKKYGGDCDAPELMWPPIFPIGKIEMKGQQTSYTEEELINELKNGTRIIPPPKLASLARASTKDPKKKGLLPQKTYYLQDRIERRDSFNGVISEETMAIETGKGQDGAAIEEKKSVEHTPPVIEKMMEIIPGKNPEESKIEPTLNMVPIIAMEVLKIEKEDHKIIEDNKLANVKEVKLETKKTPENDKMDGEPKVQTADTEEKKVDPLPNTQTSIPLCNSDPPKTEIKKGEAEVEKESISLPTGKEDKVDPDQRLAEKTSTPKKSLETGKECSKEIYQEQSKSK